MEIKSSELRVGNVLKEKYSGHKLVVSELTKDRITFDYQTEDKWQAMPIEINDEILLKCGFVMGKDLNWGNPVIDIDGISWMGTNFSGVMFFNQTKPPCKYLHQLQNLYFALTGKELTINL